MSRHDIRRLAFQTLFAMSSNPDAVATDVYQTVLGKDIEAPEYLTQLVDGVNEHLAEIDEAIAAMPDINAFLCQDVGDPQFLEQCMAQMRALAEVGRPEAPAPLPGGARVAPLPQG